jgi:hypothetical protein
MASQIQKIISFQELFSDTTDHFLQPFEEVVDPDINTGMHLTFELSEKVRKKKFSPILRLATVEDAKEIVNIYLDIYKGTYPFKEMEDIEEVRRLIENNSFQWLMFTDAKGTVVGCFTFQLDFQNKRGYMRGFNIKPSYQGSIDVVKACIGSMIGMWSTYHNKIAMWYCENRTAHAKSQYIAQVCGIKPIAFFPCKDIFFNKVESDIMQIVYKKETLTRLRSTKIPEILPEVKPSFLYSNSRYQLGEVIMNSPRIRLNLKLITELSKFLNVNNKKGKYGYETYKLWFRNSDSYIKFLYTPTVQNIEKISYNVSNVEELFVLVYEFKKIATDLKARYYECFVSAYEPTHQKIFLNAGFVPRGYIPCWKYIKKLDKFEDCIVFNSYEGRIDENIQFIEEGWNLLKSLGTIQNSS